MSGHSKWHQIRHKKGVADSKRGQIFTKHAKLITIAAKNGGGDPMMNPSLKVTIERAKVDNLPNANIERAIKRGTGELKDALELFEGFYDVYGPSGTAFFVKVVTDNKNRTLANLKTILNKNGGRMGEAGSVAWMFEQRGIINVNAAKDEREEVELHAIDMGALEINPTVLGLEIQTEPSALLKIKEMLEEKKIKIDSAEIAFVSKNTVNVQNKEEAKKLLNLCEVLEDDEDVTAVYSNYDIPEELLME